MKLIPNWKQSYKWFSQQALIAIGLVNGIATAIVPIYPKAAVVVAAATAVVAALGNIGRVIEQPGTGKTTPEPTEHL